MTKFILTILISSLSGIVYSSSNGDQWCKTNDFELGCQPKNTGFYQSVLDNALKSHNQDAINLAIDEIVMLESLDTWKDDALGLLYMLRNDGFSYEASEKHLLKAYASGSKQSAQNLAELYFHAQKYNFSFKYLNIVKGYNYQFPSKEYVNWSRLYAEHLYIGLPDNEFQEKGIALMMFNQIASQDDSGISYYFLGYDAFHNNNINMALSLLEKSSDMGHLPAILLLGDIYFIGKNVAKDLFKAKKYYLKGISNKSGHAHYYLAMVFKEEKNIIEMKKHLIHAAQLGNQEAIDLSKKIKK